MALKTKRGFAVDLTGDWRKYTDSLPRNSRAIGIVEYCGMNGAKDAGALAWIDIDGVYVKVIAGKVWSLPQSQIIVAVDNARAGSQGGAGRGGGVKAKDGATAMQRRNVMLDAESVRILIELGDGALSLGARRAAAHIAKCKLL
jgi:hypothetical protein